MEFETNSWKQCPGLKIMQGKNIQGRREGGAGGALCPRASGSKGPHNWRILTFGLQEMLGNAF